MLGLFIYIKNGLDLLNVESVMRWLLCIAAIQINIDWLID